MKQLALILCLIFCLGLSACQKPLKEQSFFAMDTLMSIKIDQAKKDMIPQIIQLVNSNEKKFSVNIETSLLSLLNQEKTSQNQELIGLVYATCKFAQISDGALDPSIRPALLSWGFTTEQRQRPSEEEIKKARSKIGYERISFEAGIKLEPEMELDLGAVVKGYTLDQVVKVLKAQQVKEALINLGGSVYAYSPDKSHRIALEDPQSKEIALILKVQNQAVLSSSASERKFTAGTKVYHHILDPQTAKPVQSDLRQASIVADSAFTADALSTACFVLGKEKSLKLWQEYGESLNFELVLIDESGKIYLSSGLAASYESKDQVQIIKRSKNAK